MQSKQQSTLSISFSCSEMNRDRFWPTRAQEWFQPIDM